jgi:hypothetical protein
MWAFRGSCCSIYLIDQTEERRFVLLYFMGFEKFACSTFVSGEHVGCVANAISIFYGLCFGILVFCKHFELIIFVFLSILLFVLLVVMLDFI